MPSLRTIVLATAASAVTLVNADYVIDPESVPLSLRKVWCQNEIETCPMICGQTSKGDTKVNECNPVSLIVESWTSRHRLTHWTSENPHLRLHLRRRKAT
jgi:hypothetical protein